MAAFSTKDLEASFGTVDGGRGGDGEKYGDISHASADARHRAGSLREQLRGDWWNVWLLLLLYTLQGIPMGLASTVPLILSMKGVSYTNQAMFSLTVWPYSIKLLWAPIVDSVYSPSFGRRKSWLVPVQLAVGVIMVVLGYHVDDLLDGEPDVFALTAYFFVLYFLVATQDIAVDGWALTLLSKRNIGYAANTNAIGQTLGYLIAYVVFMAFNSPEFCNAYVRTVPQAEGMLSLADFMFFWGMVFLVTTTGVWFFKREAPEKSSGPNAGDDPGGLGVWATYRQMWRIVWLPSAQQLCVALLTCRFGFAAADAITQLKLVEHGMPKEHLALLAVVLSPIGVLCPALLGRFTGGPRPLSLWLRAYPFRLIISLMFPVIVYVGASATEHTAGPHAAEAPDGGEASSAAIPWGFYGLVLALSVLHQIASNSMFVSQMAFYARVSSSDTSVGATYMTMLNTVTNLGVMMPNSSVLYLVGIVSTSCTAEQVEQEGCQAHDGYYSLAVACFVVGIGWYLLMARRVNNLQTLPESAWRVAPE